MRAAADTLRSGPPELRRATTALAATQLISWGVLYYTFAVVAPAMARQAGWGITAVSGAFSVGLLVSGISAPAVAVLLGRFGARRVMTAGSLLGVVATLLWAAATSLVTLYAAWVLLGAAMAATLYEPATVVLTLLDSRRMRRAIAAIAVAGGLASTVFVPLTQHLVETLGWRAAVAVLGCAGGAVTATLHGLFLPQHAPAQHDSPLSPSPLVRSRPMRRVHLASMLEQASGVAVTALVVMMLVDRGVDPRVAGLVLASRGVGKVAGRLLLAGRGGRVAPEFVAAAATASQAAAVLSMLASTSTPWLCLAGLASGAAAGTGTVLRPLITAKHTPLHAFAMASARLQVSTTLARAVAPLIVGGVAAHVGWAGGWVLAAGGLAAAAVVFAAIGTRARRAGPKIFALQAVTRGFHDRRNVAESPPGTVVRVNELLAGPPVRAIN